MSRRHTDLRSRLLLTLLLCFTVASAEPLFGLFSSSPSWPSLPFPEEAFYFDDEDSSSDEARIFTSNAIGISSVANTTLSASALLAAGLLGKTM